jgi:ketosteroid isomerase-like protein
MTNREIIEKYFELANAGRWDEWCDLFTEDCEMDEQLGGHITGQAKLREIMSGFPQAYKSFSNVPKHISKATRARR